MRADDIREPETRLRGDRVPCQTNQLRDSDNETQAIALI